MPKLFSTHLHRYYEFLYFVGGSATYIVEGKEYSAQPGDLFITRPGELHSIAFLSEEAYERHFIQISENLLKNLDVDLLSLINSYPFGEGNKIPAHLVEESNIKDAFKGVEKYVCDRREESDILVKTYIIQLLAEINRLLPVIDEGKLKENDRIQAVKDYINKNLREDISLDKIAEHAFVDKYYLCHLFKRETGFTIKDYINLQRIALAKKLISEGMSATKVYPECGFSDYSSFYRTFKKLSGKSPRQFFR